MTWTPYYRTAPDLWPVPPRTQLVALRDVEQRRVAAVWHSTVDYPGRGLKPWFAITGAASPRVLHVLWLYRLIRLDRGAFTCDVDAALLIGRARLTPLGRRVLEAAVA